MKLKSGLLVKVIAGKFFGLISNIQRVEPKKKIVYLTEATGVNYDKTSQNKKKSQLKKYLVPIHISNVRFWQQNDSPNRKEVKKS